MGKRLNFHLGKKTRLVLNLEEKLRSWGNFNERFEGKYKKILIPNVNKCKILRLKYLKRRNTKCFVRENISKISYLGRSLIKRVLVFFPVQSGNRI